MKRARSYTEELKESLKDPARAAGYLRTAYRDTDKRVFLLALKDVIEAQSNMSEIARKAKLDRRHLYVMLSGRGNPEWFSLNQLLDALGIRLSFEAKTSRETKEAA